MVLNFTQFLLLIIFALLLMIVIFLSTGIFYTKDGYVSFIEKRRKFYKAETRKITYGFPFVYRKRGYYPIKFKPYKISKNRIILVKAIDPNFLYQRKINLKKLLKQNKNLEEISKQYYLAMKEI